MEMLEVAIISVIVGCVAFFQGIYLATKRHINIAIKIQKTIMEETYLQGFKDGSEEVMGKVKQKLIDDPDYWEDQEIKDHYALWEKVDEEGEDCENCPYCERTPDAYGTGDSPTLRECTAQSPVACPGVSDE